MSNESNSSVPKAKVLGIVYLVVVLLIVVGGIYWWQNGDLKSRVENQPEVVCVQKIQLARNPATGEEKIFSSPCEVPPNWEAVNEVSESTTWETYTNGEYGFELRLPEVWKGYKVVKEQQGSAFGNPTMLKFGVKSRVGTAYPMQIVMYPILNWNDLTQESKNAVVFLTNNDQYVFAYKQWEGPPSDLLNVNFEVPKVMATFKLTMPDTVQCGGLAGTPCPTTGYDCQPEGDYPDAMTVCKKQNQ